MKSEAELKKDVAEFKKGIIGLERYRNECYVPVMRYRHVYKFCFVIFMIYIILWAIFILILSKPFFAPLLHSHFGQYITMWSMLHMTTFVFVTPISGVIMLFCLGKHFHRIRDYMELAKETYTTTVMNLYFKEAEYRPGIKIPDKILDVFTSFMPAFTHKKFEEHIECELGGAKMHFINAKFEKKTEESKITVFQGLVLEAELPETMHFETYIVPKRSKKYDGLYKVQFDSEFGKVFDVFSNEHILAKKYIDNIFGAKLMKLTSHLSSVPVCAILKNKLYMTLPLNFDPYGLAENVEQEIKLADTKPLINALGDVYNIINVLKPYKEAEV